MWQLVRETALRAARGRRAPAGRASLPQCHTLSASRPCVVRVRPLFRCRYSDEFITREVINVKYGVLPTVVSATVLTFRYYYCLRRRSDYRRPVVRCATAIHCRVFAADIRARFITSCRIISCRLIPTGHNSCRDRQRIYRSPLVLLLGISRGRRRLRLRDYVTGRLT